MNSFHSIFIMFTNHHHKCGNQTGNVFYYVHFKPKFGGFSMGKIPVFVESAMQISLEHYELIF